VLHRVDARTFYPQRSDEPIWTESDREGVLAAIRSQPRQRADRVVPPQDG
jgi:hypothetical protein